MSGVKSRDFGDSASFPKVILVRNIPRKEHPLARYLKRSKTIELSAEEMRKYEAEARRFAVYHELGHFWRTTILGVPEGGLDEDFADAFANHFLKPAFLRNRSDTHMFAGNDAENIERFAEEVIKKLEDDLWKV